MTGRQETSLPLPPHTISLIFFTASYFYFYNIFFRFFSCLPLPPHTIASYISYFQQLFSLSHKASQTRSLNFGFSIMVPSWGFLLPLTLLPHTSPQTHIFNNFVFFTVSYFFPNCLIFYLSQFYIYISAS